MHRSQFGFNQSWSTPSLQKVTENELRPLVNVRLGTLCQKRADLFDILCLSRLAIWPSFTKLPPILNTNHKHDEDAVSGSSNLLNISINSMIHRFHHLYQLLSFDEHGCVVLSSLDRYICVYYLIFVLNHAILLEKSWIFHMEIFFVDDGFSMSCENVTFSFFNYFTRLGHVVGVEAGVTFCFI